MSYIINESANYSNISVQGKRKNCVEFITVLQEADAKNRNGRIYPKSVLEKGIDSPYIKERLATKSLYCEAGHPADNSVQRQMTIDLRNIACIIEEMWWEGNLLKARCVTADTEIGRDMAGLIEQGSRVAFSLRAQGNVRKDPLSGDTVVEPGIQICTWDWVCNPSHEKAYLETVCEAVAYAMKGRFGKSSMALCEAEDLFNNGVLIETDQTQEAKVIDYTQHYTPKLKSITEMYIYDESDEVVSIAEGVVTLNANGVLKKVTTEDYLVKDIRNKISNL